MCICVSHLQDAQDILSVNILSEAEWDLSEKWLKNIALYRAFSKWVSSSPSQCEVGRSWEPQPLLLGHSSENAAGGEETMAILSPFLAGARVLIHSGTSGSRAASGSPRCNGTLPLAQGLVPLQAGLFKISAVAFLQVVLSQETGWGETISYLCLWTKISPSYRSAQNCSLPKCRECNSPVRLFAQTEVSGSDP